MSSSNKQRARLSFLAGCLCAVSVVASAASEDDFNTAYESYRVAAAEGRNTEAAEHAARAKQLGEALFPDDARRTAMLACNHGFALSQTNRRAEAHELLELALPRLREAYGKDSKEVMHVEVALASAAVPTKAGNHLKRTVKIARLRGAADSEFIANANLMVGMRPRDRHGVKLLEQAAAAFERPNQPTIALLAHLALVEAFERQGRRDAATGHCLAIGRWVPWAGKADYEPLYRGREGWVNMEFTVDENGIARDAKVLESEGGPGFEVSAVEAMRGFAMHRDSWTETRWP